MFCTIFFETVIEDEEVTYFDKKKRTLNTVFGIRHWEHNIGNKPQSPSIEVTAIVL